jgi:MOSC domain-containing protein YiiM
MVKATPPGTGGEQRAIFVYRIESHRYWSKQLKRTDFVYGQFGENFTIEGWSDDATRIGDRYQIGSALFEVTQPRVICYCVGVRMIEPRMPALLTSSGRPGFYFRVLQEGDVSADDEIVKIDVHCRSRRFRPDGARRSRHRCKAQQAVTQG